MDIKHEEQKTVKTMSFSKYFLGYEDPIMSKEIYNLITESVSHPNQPERSKREDFKVYDDFNLKCGCHSEPGIFSKHIDCNLEHEDLIP